MRKEQQSFNRDSDGKCRQRSSLVMISFYQIAEGVTSFD